MGKMYSFRELGMDETERLWILERDKQNPDAFVRKKGNAYTSYFRGKTILLDRKLAKKVTGDAVILLLEEVIDAKTCFVIKKASIVDTFFPEEEDKDLCPRTRRERDFAIPGTSSICFVEDKHGLKFVIRKYRMYELDGIGKPKFETDLGHVYFDSFIFDGDFKLIENPPYQISNESDPVDYSTWYFKDIKKKFNYEFLFDMSGSMG